MMADPSHKKQDFLEVAKQEFAHISAEFEKAVEALKDPERRKELASSYLDMLQKGLSRAQDSVAKYQEKVATHPTGAAPDYGSAADSSSVAEPEAAKPDSGPEAPTS